MLHIIKLTSCLFCLKSEQNYPSTWPTDKYDTLEDYKKSTAEHILRSYRQIVEALYKTGGSTNWYHDATATNKVDFNTSKPFLPLNLSLLSDVNGIIF